MKNMGLTKIKDSEVRKKVEREEEIERETEGQKKTERQIMKHIRWKLEV